MDSSAILQAVSLGDLLYERLASLIEQGEFPEGSRLPGEVDLAERFNVSRPVIRETLSRLRETGVIVSRKGSGSFVQRRPTRPQKEPIVIGFAPISSLAELRKCFEFRVGVEGEAAYCAAKHRTPKALDGLRHALFRLEEAIATGAVGVDVDYDFHMLVARASDNDFIEAVMMSMRGSIEFAINLARSLSLKRPIDRLRSVQAEHVAVFQAIEAGDKEAARTAMRAHINNASIRVFEGT